MNKNMQNIDKCIKTFYLEWSSALEQLLECRSPELGSTRYGQNEDCFLPKKIKVYPFHLKQEK